MVAQLVQIPLKTHFLDDSLKSNLEHSNLKFNHFSNLLRDRSIIQPCISHQMEQKSWCFLSDYINKIQVRHESMKLKIEEAGSLAKCLEAEKIKKDDSDRNKKIEECRKSAENDIYERPRSKALADSFIEASTELFAMSKNFESAQESTAKNFRMKLKMAINRRTGQITDSLRQIQTIASELIQLCFESRTISKQAFSYCLFLLSNKLLAQAESQVSLHTPSAFPLALVAVEISTSVIEFPSVLMALLIKKCCFAIPKYPRKADSDEAFKIELGYLLVDGIIKESDSAFFERMSGLISFYSAIIQTSSLSGKPNVLGLNLGWTWLATILNLPPRSITPYLLVSFLEQSSYAFYQKYGINFENLMKFIIDKYIPLIPNSSIAIKIRLEILCKEFFSSDQGRIKEPAGRSLEP